MYIVSHKIVIFYVSITLLSFSCIDKSKKNDTPKINEIELIYQDLFTLTPIRIRQENFETTFQKTLKTKIISSPEDIENVLQFLNETKAENKTVKNLDIRYKMILKSNTEEERVIYGNGGVIQIESIKYIISREFSNFLINITESSLNKG